MKKIWSCVAALAVILPSLVVATEPSTDLPPIVAKSIDFHGAEAFHDARVSLTLASASGSSRIEAWTDGQGFEYVVGATTRDGEERRVRFSNLDGDNRVEQWLDGAPVEMDAEGAGGAERWLMARVYFPFLPFRLADPGVYFQDLGVETWGERDLHRVKVTFEPGSSPDADDEFLYWFDPDSGRMEQFAYSFHTGNGGLRLRQAIEFQRVGGILFSDQANLGVNFPEGGPSQPVDVITPAFAAEEMERVSTVTLEDVVVEPAEVAVGGDAGGDS